MLNVSMNKMSPGLAYWWNFTDNQYTDIDLSQPIYRPMADALSNMTYKKISR